MKKFILLMTLLTVTLSAKPCMTDIYFGNGVWNDRRDAIDNMDALKKFMLYQANIRLNPQKETIDYQFKYAHNPSYGHINDLIETFWQLKESGQISEGYFSAVYAALTWEESTEFYNKLTKIILQYNQDVTTMYTMYQNASFNQKHNVLLVAHSQGNLWGNKMYSLFTNEQKKKFRMVSVATPANYVMVPEKTNPYVTASEDYIINSTPGSLPSNVDGIGHTFIGTYLVASINAPRKIASYLKSAYDDLMQNSTCDTYQYYVWISYLWCPAGFEDQELVVDIYGRPANAPYPYTKVLVATDSRTRMPRDKDGKCTVQGDDIFSFQEKYNKNGCYAYSIDDTSGNLHTIDQIAANSYINEVSCTKYVMNPEITTQLKKQQAE